MDFLDTEGCQVLITVVLGLILLLYIYGQWPMFYWSRRNMKGPKPLPFLGNILEFRKRGMNHCFINWTKKYGRVYGLYLLRRPLLVVTDPDMLKEIMVKNFSNFTDKYTMTDRKANHPLFSKMLPFSRGAEWKRMRSITNPAFTSGKLKSMEIYINECSDRLAKKLYDKAVKKERIDSKEVYGAFTLDMIAALLFGVGMDSMSDRDNPMFYHAKTILNNTTMFKVVFLLSGLFPILQTPLRLLGLTQLPKKHVDFFIQICSRIVKDRKNNDSSSSVDFLQMLINAESQDVDFENMPKKLSSYEITAQVAIFFVAGYETTAKTLQFLSHHLAENTDIQNKLIQEIDAVIGNEAVPSTESLHRLKYTDAVITETLRMYPPIPYLTRETISDCEIKGVKIESGVGVFIPAFAIGRDPDFYPDPETFNPDRFINRNNGLNDMTYQPFGNGPRQCIGMRLAMKEIKIALVHVLRKVEFSDASEIKWPKTFNPTFLQTESPLFVSVKPRANPGL